MKKTIKKITAAGLAITSVMGLVACGSTKQTETSTTQKIIERPGKFTVMANGTVTTEANNSKAFYDQLSAATGLEIEWIRPDHSGYVDAVANAFNSTDTMPDVVILPLDQYTLYAANGYLWDMTEAWEKSATKNSGRLSPIADDIYEKLKVNGPDGEPHLYTFTTARGSGCVTYIKEKWLTDAGLTKAAVEDKSLTFSEYYSILKKLHEAHPSVPVISAPGFIGPESPYTNYLPEFYQQAQYTFYKDSTGKYVDGFEQDSMKQALIRIATGVKDGIIDKESINNTTSNCRDKFYSDKSGVFTYWAGTWAETLRANLSSRNIPDSLIAMKPVKEQGAYLERVMSQWSITTHAQNPEGIYKYFIDTMLDGDKVQKLWTFGAEDVHWSTKAGSVTLKGKESNVKTYNDGEFHFLPSTETPTTLLSKNNIDPLLSISKFTNGDPSVAATVPLTIKNQEFFNQNSVSAVPLPMTDELGDNIGDINKARNNAIADVVTGSKSADQAIADYKKQVGSLVDTVLKSLNK